MSYHSVAMLPSLYGRRLGLQQMSSNVSGSGRAGAIPDLIVGAEALRMGVTTAESTASNLFAWGISVVPGTSAASSSVYVLDPPIPGVQKFIVSAGGGANGPTYVRTANSETITTTQGSSFTTVKMTTPAGGFSLIGVTTATWMALGLTSGTSSQASGFSMTTTT